MKLQEICALTISTPDLHRQITAYRDYLGFRVVEQEKINQATADLWGAPAMVGASSATMCPAARPDHWFRFIERGARNDFRPFGFFGWNAVEVVVADVDALAEELRGSPFETLGPPDDLSISDQIRAMQVVGPGGELLYLTQIKGPVPGFDLPMAKTPVEHCFVTILGGPSMDAMKAFYSRRFGLVDAPTVQARVTVLSRAFGLPREHYHPIAAAPLGTPGYLLEMDQMPEQAVPRPVTPGELGPGISMVSYTVTDFAHLEKEMLGPAIVAPGAPYQGRRAGCVKGPTGELLELIEARDGD